MRIAQKLLFLLFTILFCQNSLTAFSDSFIFSNDTIPEVTPIYKGNRIMVKSIKVIKQRGSNVKIQYNLVNTGKNKIKLGKGKIIPRDLIVTFDKSLESNDLMEAKDAIIESLKKQKISIRPGQLIMSNKIKFSYASIPPTDRIAKTETETEKEEPLFSETPSNSVDEKSVENTASKTEIVEEIETDKIEEQEISDPIAEIIETVSAEETELILASPRFDDEQKEVVIEELDETILTKENNSTAEETVLGNAEIKVLPSIKEKEMKDLATENRDTIFDTETSVEVYKEEKITSDSKNEKSNLDKNLCGDLVLQDVEVIKKNKRYVVVKYTITNVGNYPIALLGETKKVEDNIALQAHFTRSNKLTRGSIPVKLAFIKKGLKDKKGILEPNESFSSKLKIETSKMTKFTPVLALSLNPFNITTECSKLNNTIFLNIANQDAPPPADPLPIKPKLEVEEGAEVIGARN